MFTQKTKGFRLFEMPLGIQIQSSIGKLKVKVLSQNDEATIRKTCITFILNMIEKLAPFLILFLILSHSNADVEKLFSNMKIIKNNQRDKMGLSMLILILMARASLTLADIAWNSCHAPENAIKQIGAKNLYQRLNDITLEADGKFNF